MFEYQILNYWNDNDDLYVDYIVKDIENDLSVHACTLFNTDDFDDYITRDDLNDEFIKILKENNGIEFSLPKTSELNEITYNIYKELCQSDNNMLWIEDEEDFDYYQLNDHNYYLLKEDIEKYNLDDYFDINRNKITVYGGLQCCFNDDREAKEIEYER